MSRSAAEFWRREGDWFTPEHGGLLLTQGRPVVVVAQAVWEDLRSLRRFVIEQAPTIVAVGDAADDLLDLGWACDVVVIESGDRASIASTDALRAAAEVVVVAPRGSSTARSVMLNRDGIVARRLETSAGAEDVALLLADGAGAPLVVAVGLAVRLQDALVDEGIRGPSLAARLRLGSRLVDAGSVRALGEDRSRTLALFLVLLAGLLALLLAISVTPVGQRWVTDLGGFLTELL